MSIPSTGITPDVIRGIMPPYHLSTDLLAGAVTALPRPPPNASAAWRQARLTRLVQEIGGLMPADAPQARIAAQIVVVREATDDTLARSYAPALPVEQVCRLRRTAADLARTAATLERGLARRQAKPAPFFGTTLAEGVDIAALDRVWCEGGLAAAEVRPGQCQDGDMPAGWGDPTDGPVPGGMAGLIPGSSPRTAMTNGNDGNGLAAAEGGTDDRPTAAEGESGDDSAAAEREGGNGSDVAEREGGRSPAVAVGRQARAGLGQDAGAAPEWVVTQLDEGPGWTREVVRRRTGAGAAPGSAA